MEKQVVNTQLFGGFIMPDELNEILDLDGINIFSELQIDTLYKSLETINDLVLVDNEDDTMQVLEGGFSFQCISMALKTIEKITVEKPLFFIETVRIFKLDQYLRLDDIIKEKRAIS